MDEVRRQFRQTIILSDRPTKFDRDVLALDITGSKGLQNAMRLAESRLAGDLFATVKPDLFVLDGPLTYFALAGPVVGMIKRQNRPYLKLDKTPILAALRLGERTPGFASATQTPSLSNCNRFQPRQQTGSFCSF